MKRGAALALLLVAAVTLSACGKKGEPQPPAGEPNVYPRFYPPPSAESGATTDQAKPVAPSPPP